jgi:hypothetical protein
MCQQVHYVNGKVLGADEAWGGPTKWGDFGITLNRPDALAQRFNNPPQVILKEGLANKGQPLLLLILRSRQQNDLQARSNGGGTLSQLVPGHARHVHVGNEHLHARVTVVELGESFGSIESRLDLAPEFFKPRRRQQDDQSFIVHDKNSHGTPGLVGPAFKLNPSISRLFQRPFLSRMKRWLDVQQMSK